MAELLGAATGATKLFLEVNQVSIDNWTFKLFYKVTTSLLMACAAVASSKQFFGEPISCEVVMFLYFILNEYNQVCCVSLIIIISIITNPH